MNRFCSTFLLLCGIASHTLAQTNLIPNPSFENYLGCDYDLYTDSLEAMVSDWSFVLSSPRLFHNDCVDDPNSDYYQNSLRIAPSDGDAVINSVFHFTPSGLLDRRHGFQCTLIEALQPGSAYYFSMDIALPSAGSRSISHFGAHFTDTLWRGTMHGHFFGHPPLLLDPTIEFDYVLPLEDQLPIASRSWLTLEDCFIADSAHQVMMVGVFAPQDSVERPDWTTGSGWFSFDNFHLYQIPPELALEAEGDTLCEGACITLRTNMSNIPGEWSWSLPGSDIGTSTDSAVVVCYDAPGVYDIDVTVVNCARQYDGFFADAIVVMPEPTHDLPEDTTICPGSDIVIEHTSTEGIRWFDGSTQTSRTFSDQGTYTFEILDPHCTVRDSIHLFWSSMPERTNTDIQLCEGDSLRFGDRWYSEAQVLSDTLLDAHGCDSLYSTINLTIRPTPEIIWDGAFTFCEHEVRIMDVSSPAYQEIIWEDGAAALPRSFSSPGTYAFTITDASGCTQVDSITLSQVPAPWVTLPPLIDVWYQPDLALQPVYSEDVTGYAWTPADPLDCPDCPAPVVVTPYQGRYQVIAQNETGCTDTASTVLQLRIADIYIANAIRPSSTISTNQRLFAQSGASYTYDMRVFDRWGGQIFYQQDLVMNQSDMGWRPGEDVAHGMYVYQITYVENGQTKTINGEVFVIE